MSQKLFTHVAPRLLLQLRGSPTVTFTVIDKMINIITKRPVGGNETNRKAISLFICQVPGYQCKYKHEHVAISLNEDIGNFGVT